MCTRFHGMSIVNVNEGGENKNLQAKRGECYYVRIKQSLLKIWHECVYVCALELV